MLCWVCYARRNGTDPPIYAYAQKGRCAECHHQAVCVAVSPPRTEEKS